jgi:hypothetical protein
VHQAEFYTETITIGTVQPVTWKVEVSEFMPKAKSTFAAIFVGIVMSATGMNAQITGNVTSRVFFIQVRDSRGTAFAIEADGRQYLITAKHVVKDIGDEEVIQIRKDGIWSPLNVRVYRCDDPVDIAVLVPPRQLSNADPISTTGSMWFPGQEMFFLGYPYGNDTDIRMPGGYPVPLAKRAVLSGMQPLGANKKGMEYVLDGYNNPGFSGAPLVFRDTKTGLFVIAGVMVTFRADGGQVCKTTQITESQITEDDIKNEKVLQHDGKFFRITEKTTDMVRLNTGIAYAHDIEFATSLIHDLKLDGPKVSVNFKP